MKAKTVGIIISVAIAILLGAILIGIIADNVAERQKFVSYTETVDISPVRLAGGTINYTATVRLLASDILAHPASGNWRTDYTECAISSVNYYNQSGALMSNSADYTWVEDGNGIVGWLRPKNSANLNSSLANTTTIVYTTCADDFVVAGWGRTVMNMVPGFFAIAILLAGAFVIFWILKEEGINLDI